MELLEKMPTAGVPPRHTQLLRMGIVKPHTP
jgi:hypothetical protein